MTAPSSFYSGAYAPISSFNATSSDLVTIAAGPQTFNIQSGKTFLAGMGIQILSLSTNNLMAGSVTSYSGTVLVVNVTSTIGSGTFSDWQITLAGSPGAQGATGSTGAAGSNGSNGTNGTGFTTTSTTSLVTAGAGSKVFTTTQAANTLAWTAGARLRATSAGTGEWMEGLVTAYSGTTLTVTMDSNSGTGTHADWNINPAGQAGANGSGVAGQTAHNVCIAASATSLAAGVALGANQILVGAAGADPAAATVSGDLTNVAGAFTIANSAVTYAKIQNVAAGAILGRATGAGAGVMTELTAGQAATNIGGTVLALFQASTWKTFYTDGSSVLQSLSVGAAGTSLVGNGASAAPSFAAWATAPQYAGNSSNAILATNNVWTAAAPATLTDGATVTPDFSSAFDFIWTIGATGRTLANPTSPKAGQKGVIYIVQDGTGSRTITTWGTQYKFASGVKPTLTTTAGAIDLISYCCKSTTEIECFFTGNMS